MPASAVGEMVKGFVPAMVILEFPPRTSQIRVSRKLGATL